LRQKDKKNQDEPGLRGENERDKFWPEAGSHCGACYDGKLKAYANEAHNPGNSHVRYGRCHVQSIEDAKEAEAHELCGPCRDLIEPSHQGRRRICERIIVAHDFGYLGGDQAVRTINEHATPVISLIDVPAWPVTNASFAAFAASESDIFSSLPDA
jgi:hypothetical protein